jgi:hypothetical protein
MGTGSSRRINNEESAMKQAHRPESNQNTKTDAEEIRHSQQIGTITTTERSLIGWCKLDVS